MDLRLFPLGNVLFPGMRMPLHIFEERYRLMVGRCIEAGDPFGVVLIREGREAWNGENCCDACGSA
jgi:Lon protease-like protein